MSPLPPLQTHKIEDPKWSLVVTDLSIGRLRNVSSFRCVKPVDAGRVSIAFKMLALEREGVEEFGPD